MVVTNEQRDKLKKYIFNVDDFIERNDVQDLLDEIDNVIVDNILGNNDEPDGEGIMLQRIYDQIFIQN